MNDSELNRALRLYSEAKEREAASYYGRFSPRGRRRKGPRPRKGILAALVFGLLLLVLLPSRGGGSSAEAAPPGRSVLLRTPLGVKKVLLLPGEDGPEPSRAFGRDFTNSYRILRVRKEA